MKHFCPNSKTMLMTVTSCMKCPEKVANRGLNKTKEGLIYREYKRKQHHVVGNKGLKNMSSV